MKIPDRSPRRFALILLRGQACQDGPLETLGAKREPLTLQLRYLGPPELHNCLRNFFDKQRYAISALDDLLKSCPEVALRRRKFG